MVLHQYYNPAMGSSLAVEDSMKQLLQVVVWLQQILRGHNQRQGRQVHLIPEKQNEISILMRMELHLQQCGAAASYVTWQ